MKAGGLEETLMSVILKHTRGATKPEFVLLHQRDFAILWSRWAGDATEHLFFRGVLCKVSELAWPGAPLVVLS